MPCKWFMTRNFFTATTAEHFFFVSTLFVYKGSREEGWVNFYDSGWSRTEI